MTIPPTNRETLVAVRDTALRLLARREHAVLELRHKLKQRDYPADVIETVLAELQAQGWLNEQRFAEVYAANRADKGYGPLRIRSELRARGVTDPIIDPILAQLDDIWLARLRNLSRKRFGNNPPRSLAERARRQRFLRQRGFTLDQIDQLHDPD